jgi:hypothetical protein
MKYQLKLLTGISVMSILLLTTALGVSAEAPTWQSATTGAELTQPAPTTRLAPAGKGCTKMEVSDQALWFSVDEDGNVDSDQPVDSYPKGTTVIAAGFEYNCVPPRTTIVTVFYKGGLDTDPWYTDKDPLEASDSGGVYSYQISLKSGKPLPDDSYQVQFFNNKEALASGEVVVGGSGSGLEINGNKQRDQNQGNQQEKQKQNQRQSRDPNKVRIEGVVTDLRTGRPIPHAVFLVLNPGISVAQWADYAYAPSDILSYAETNRDGEFALAEELDRNQEYSTVTWALSYQGYYQDGFVVTEDDPDPYELTIELTR